MKKTQIYRGTIRNEREELRAQHKQLLFDLVAPPEQKMLEILAVYEATPTELQYLLNKAAISGYVEVVRFLIEQRNVDPSHNDSFSLILASKHNHPNVISIILNDSRTLYQDLDNKAIIIACVQGYLECVRLLLGDGRVHPETNNNHAAFQVNIVIAGLLHEARNTTGLEAVSPGTLIQNLDASKGSQRIKVLLERYITILSLLLNDRRVTETLDEETRAHYSRYLGG